MESSVWIEELRIYYSHHILIRYLGEKLPKYLVLENPDGYGWVIGVFFPFVGEYAPLEEEGEDRLAFHTAKEARTYVDNNLD
ncbi:hypothetical protein B14911_10722 [Bacillus sp. NRRL B-14911]|uniref:hypothetical protein n=1 Tax=Bacillus sp. NRRL B-14911 TaxID=313627 RepID=UPI00006B594E|nr:hypothetical protein [Bacillus sp. NRRL B-14911]EAR66202.1 hypothetical protein B14911_10722 [Bacillus sp. NRRL B-14911]